ncbi:MAG: REP-associated tyrosine transposase [Planctomycetota bacterium]
MPDYRRLHVPGGTYFFTCVTYGRRKILTTDLGRECLRTAIEKTRSRRAFEIVAIVLLPDHWHTVWTLPQGDANYSIRWMRIKEEFSKHWLAEGGTELKQSSSRVKHRQRGIWQKRYWEHTVRDEDDLKRCVDYIHWNPRKHGLVERVCDWQWSSFQRMVESGEYEREWGGIDPAPGWDAPEWGE